MPTTGELVPGVRKIAVLRANALGDYIFTIPALEALRAAYPDAEIVLLGKAWHRAFLPGRPGPVDRVEVVPPYPGVSGPEDLPHESEALDSFFRAMQAERFDLALQMQGGGRNSNPFTLRLGARLTAGTRSPEAAPLDRTIPYIYFQRETLRFLEVASLVGAAPVSLEPHLSLTRADCAELQPYLPTDQGPLVVIHPGVSSPDRQWPPEKFAAVADALAARGACLVLTGTEEERDLTQRVRGLMTHPALDLAGRLSVGGLAALLDQARLLVSNDTGPLHLAEALGTNTVGIFWGINLVNGGPMTRARHRPVISWRTACPRCGRDQLLAPCDHPVSYVADVSVEEVLTQALDLYTTDWPAIRPLSAPD